MNDRDPHPTDPHPLPSGASRLSRGVEVALRVAIAALAVGTAYIHSTLGGDLYTLNAIGYAVGAAAIIVPLAIAQRYRWLIRIALAGYAATTIVAWTIQGPHYTTAYLAKVIELALIALLVIDFALDDGNRIERLRREVRWLSARAHGRAAGRP